MSTPLEERLRAYLIYFRDLGVYDFYRRGEQGIDVGTALLAHLRATQDEPDEISSDANVPASISIRNDKTDADLQPNSMPHSARSGLKAAQPAPGVSIYSAPSISEEDPELIPESPGSRLLTNFNDLAPLPPLRIAVPDKASALKALNALIGDCTRCPLAYAGRHSIVFGDGNPDAELMFVGEGPGADEDASGLPFVGKAGKLLDNMISAMGLKREQVYIANIVKCRPPGNRVPEPVEANTCSPFLLQQMDIVQPKVIVALGATAATYLLGVKQPLAALRGRWHNVRGAKTAVTYHPSFLLRDPSHKGEAWKDLQRVMVELGLRAVTR